MKARRLPQGGIVLEVLENLQEIIWGKIASGVKGFIKSFIENLLEEELTAKLGASRYERSSGRKAYRNGHYLRNLLTRYGTVDEIRVPRAEKGGMAFSVFDRYEHRRRDVDAALGRLFLNGVSTRKLKGIAREIYGKEVSPQTVSSTLSSLDEALSQFKDKPIEDDIEFLFLDGLSQKVLETDTEDEASWKGFLADLKGRGLLKKHLKLIVTDGNPALLKAVKSLYPFTKV